MGQRIIISEEERSRIKGLYEQSSSKPFNFFDYKDTVYNMIKSMTSLMENIEKSKLCQTLDDQLKPTFGLVDDLVARMAADNRMSEGESIKYVYDTWGQQKTSGMSILMKLIGGNMSVSKEMVDKLYEHIRKKQNGNLLTSIISDIFGSARINQIPMCS